MVLWEILEHAFLGGREGKGGKKEKENSVAFTSLPRQMKQSDGSMSRVP